MSEAVEIHIKGGRGRGKTIVAAIIVQVLRNLGQRVQYRGHSDRAELALEEMLHEGIDLRRHITEFREVVVVDQETAPFRTHFQEFLSGVVLEEESEPLPDEPTFREAR